METMKNEIRLPKGYELKELEKGVYEIVKAKFKLEVGKDYINKRFNHLIVIDRVGGKNNFAFEDDRGFILNDCQTPNLWREATESEVVEAFKKELIRRYGENWEDVKVKECMFHMDPYYFNNYENIVMINKSETGWEVWNNNACLYRNGKWAEVLEEIPTIELRGLDSNIKYCSMHKNKAVYVWYTKPTVVQLKERWHGQGVYAIHLDQSQFTELKKLNWKDSLHKIKHV